MTIEAGDRVSCGGLEASVVAIADDAALLAYAPGGSGWWPLDVLTAIEGSTVDGHASVAADYAAAQAATLAVARARAMRAVKVAVDAVGDAALAGYSRAEIQSWPQQEAAARGVIAGTASDDDAGMIAALAAPRGLTSAEMAALILGKAGPFRDLAVALSTLRAQAHAGIEAAEDEAGVATALATLRTGLADLSPE